MSPRPKAPGSGDLPRLLRGIGSEPLIDLDAHIAVHGALRDLHQAAPEAIAGEIERAGLRGHGGAAFPTARKWRSVAARRRPKYVVVNATEGEPASQKDRVLVRDAPHLVLDGAAVAARAVGAREAIVAVSEAAPDALEAVAHALDERRRRMPADPQFTVVETPEMFLAGQETALVSFINGGAAAPIFGVRPYERGVRGRATLVQNAETLAHAALIVRHGAAWFRGLGTDQDPGTALLTVGGAVTAPGVYEIAHGTPLSELLATTAPTEQLQAVLIGGYFGTWLPASEISTATLSPGGLRAHGASLGAGIIVALGRSTCAVAETARVARWFAGQSAGQCGPCVHGLAAVADTVGDLAGGVAQRGTAYRDLQRWVQEIPGRGACQHPDGAVRFVASALDVFAEAFEDHAVHGRCDACSGRPVLPVGRGMALTR